MRRGARTLMVPEFDFVVVGGGMAGTAIAAHLSEAATVCLLEMEHQPGHHATGRSAALFSEGYGNDVIRALTRASRDFLFSPPAGFADAPLVRPRQVLTTASSGEEIQTTLELYPAGDAEVKTIDQVRAICPIVRTANLAGAVLSLRSADIEVHELQQGYLRLFKARRGVVRLDQRVTNLSRAGGVWRVSTDAGIVTAPIVVNAAGAWAGDLGKKAGAQDIGLQPLKRTACLIEAPHGADHAEWPMLKDSGEDYYLKPDAGMLLLSPCDESPSPPADVQADELDIAIAIDRIERATTLKVRRVAHRWAGLRSFVPDRSPVVGYDRAASGFFWYAALGGYGIQTAPALSRMAAALASGAAVDPQTLDLGATAAAMAPDRLAAFPDVGTAPAILSS